MPRNCQISGICRGQLSTFTPERPKAKPLTLSYAMFVGPLRQTAFAGLACSSPSSAPRFGCSWGLALGPRDLRLQALGFGTPEDLVPSGISAAQLRRKPLRIDAFGKIRRPRSRWLVFTGLVSPSRPSVGRLRQRPKVASQTRPHTDPVERVVWLGIAAMWIYICCRTVVSLYLKVRTTIIGSVNRWNSVEKWTCR